MKRISLIIATFGLLLASPGTVAADPSQQSLAERFDGRFHELIGREDIPGAAYAIVTPAQFIRIGVTGHTDLERKRAVDENTVFRLASVSKTFAAGLAGVIANEGAFEWNDRLLDYVPDFRIKGDTGLIHVEHLLGQSTGLIPHAYDNLVEDGLSLERINGKFSTLGYLCEPGTCYSYQNVLFSLIQPVIEQSTSSEYATLMRERLFRPLGMDNASVGLGPLVENPNHAMPHVKSRGQWRTVDVEPNYYRVAPAAGVNASVTDLGRWLMAQMGSSPAVLPGDVVETLTQPRVRTKRDLRRRHWRDILTDAHYGLGWRIYTIGEEQIVYHGGWVSGYRADIAWSRRHRIGLAILMNAETNHIGELSTAFWMDAFRNLATPSEGLAAPASP